MGEDEVADLIAACYGAAAGALPWAGVKQQICRVLKAPFAGLAMGDPRFGGRLVNLFEGEHVPLPQERLRNPYLDPARRIWAGVREQRPVVALGPEVVDDRQYVRSEYYADHGRRLEMRHEVGTTVMTDDASMTALGVYRPERAGPFGEQDRAVLIALRPHLRRALQLREALRPATAAALAGLAALDAMPQAAILVDRDLRVLHANANALGLAGPGQGIALSSETRDGGGLGQTFVKVVDHAVHAALRTLVTAVAGGGASGSAIRVAGPGKPAAIIVAVLPVPASVMDRGIPAGAAKGLALLFMRELVARASPSPHVLCDVFGLTRAEAAVAAMLTRGVTAARIAEARGVSIDTIRTQIRAVLPKVGAANLRELQHMLRTLSG